jgi:hypothetical protein
VDDGLLVEGPIGRLRADDVLQMVLHLPQAVRVAFECEDRASGAPWRIELVLQGGRLIGIGAGAGLRLGDLVVGRGFAPRADVEAAAVGAGPRLGERLVERGVLEPAELDDLVWERHARVVWSLLAWDRGWFRADSAEPALGTRSDAVPVDPPIGLEAVLLDGLQRAESALAR